MSRHNYCTDITQPVVHLPPRLSSTPLIKCPHADDTTSLGFSSFLTSTFSNPSLFWALIPTDNHFLVPVSSHRLVLSLVSLCTSHFQSATPPHPPSLPWNTVLIHSHFPHTSSMSSFFFGCSLQGFATVDCLPSSHPQSLPPILLHQPSLGSSSSNCSFSFNIPRKPSTPFQPFCFKCIFILLDFQMFNVCEGPGGNQILFKLTYRQIFRLAETEVIMEQYHYYYCMSDSAGRDHAPLHSHHSTTC